MKHKFQISESIRLGAILALSGGFMDAYSYMERGEVFANAQTGNMLLFGVHLSQGDFQNTMKYLFPVLAFALGIALAEVVRAKAGNLLHWRQISVLAEALILIAVSFFPTALNLPANALTSFACGIQVESFRKIHAKESQLQCASVICAVEQRTCTTISIQKNDIFWIQVFCITESLPALLSAQ